MLRSGGYAAFFFTSSRNSPLGNKNRKRRTDSPAHLSAALGRTHFSCVCVCVGHMRKNNLYYIEVSIIMSQWLWYYSDTFIYLSKFNFCKVLSMFFMEQEQRFCCFWRTPVTIIGFGSNFSFLLGILLPFRKQLYFAASQNAFTPLVKY